MSIFGAAVRRRRRSLADPLGAGNTALLTALGLTPAFFYDVRRNLGLSGANLTGLLDIVGDGTFGPALGVFGTPPTWDGFAVNTSASGYLLSAAGVADPSTALTVALIADIAGTAGAIAAVLGAAAAAAPWWEIPIVNTGSVFRTTTSAGANSTATSAATGGSGNMRLLVCTVNVAGTARTTIEVPTAAKVTSPTGATALAAGAQLLALGANTAGAGKIAMRFRAILGWAGGYSAGQLATLETYAETYHNVVLA